MTALVLQQTLDSELTSTRLLLFHLQLSACSQRASQVCCELPGCTLGLYSCSSAFSAEDADQSSQLRGVFGQYIFKRMKPDSAAAKVGLLLAPFLYKDSLFTAAYP